MAAASGSSFGAFPELIIDQRDVSGSWKKFSKDFVLALEFRELELGTRFNNNPRTKTVALLKAVGLEGRDFLQSVGFDLRHGTCEEALELLDGHYGREENIFVKTQKFVLVRQNNGEDERDYLV